MYIFNGDIGNKLDYCSINWPMFDTGKFVQTSETTNIKVIEDYFFVYSFAKIEHPTIEELPINLANFKIYKVVKYGFNTAIGYIIIPDIIYPTIVRFSENSIISSTPDVTEKAYRNSSKKVIFSENGIDFVWVSCGAEIITDLYSKFGVFPEKDYA